MAIGFIIMQIGNPDLDRVCADVIAPALTACVLVAKRVDKHNLGGLLKSEIIRFIEDAEIIAADLTNERPNCYLEIGYAMGLDKFRNLILCRARGPQPRVKEPSAGRTQDPLRPCRLRRSLLASRRLARIPRRAGEAHQAPAGHPAQACRRGTFRRGMVGPTARDRHRGPEEGRIQCLHAGALLPLEGQAVGRTARPAQGGRERSGPRLRLAHRGRAHP
jgi:hypothetical protein